MPATVNSQQSPGAITLVDRLARDVEQRSNLLTAESPAFGRQQARSLFDASESGFGQGIVWDENR
ncbi:MAG: hypothetical protein QOF89_25 [Acidobacteriota bacterium]|nr:hypothetical protein [Acidobacteriota bacterium]